MTTMRISQPIPGPRVLPLLGGKHNLIRLYSSPFRFLRRLRDTYGDVVGLGEGDTSYVCAFGPACNHRLLSNPELFAISAGPFDRLLGDTPLGRVGGQSLQLMKGEHHRQQRRLMMPAFHKESIAIYHQTMVRLTQERLASWQPGAPIDLYAEMRELTQQIVVQTLFGLEDEADTARLGTLLERLVAAMPMALMLPVNIPGLPYHRAMGSAAQLEIELQALIADKRSAMDGNDLLTMLIRARDEDGTALRDGELISHAFTLFTAGHETTTAALTWTIFLLCQHPAVYGSLLDELENALHGAPPAPAQVRELPLLDAVLKEGLRLLSPATVGMRRTTEACELGGFALPQGVTVIFSQFVTHRDPELYPQPDDFLPERWFSIKPGPYDYIPFSAGSHRCIGAEFAMHEMKTVLATLLQQLRLAVQPDAALNVNFTMQPKRGVPMQILTQGQPMQAAPVRGDILHLVNLPGNDAAQ